MPLPIAHSLVGASVVTLSNPLRPLKENWRLILFGAFLAISPDFDFFFIWVLHAGRGWHRIISHSIFFALMFTLLMLLVTGFSRLRMALACGAALMSHGILDYLGTRNGGGVGLFWPFSNERFKLDIFDISDLPHGITLTELFKAGLIELIIFVPILLAALMLRKYLAQASRRDMARIPPV
jgi:membrane-bound metal-dependent hydrolase YbcI (DUF457 family)